MAKAQVLYRNPTLVRLKSARPRAGPLTAGTVRLARNKAPGHSADPIHAGLIPGDRNTAVRNSADRNLGPRDALIVAGRRRSANFCTKDRRFLFKLQKNRSPRRARESLLT